MNVNNVDEVKLAHPTILLVDDSSANPGVLVECLERQGYEVHVVQDGKAALQRAAEALPDLILLDVTIAGQDGFEVCRRLKAQAHTRDIPVIFMTLLGNVEDTVQAFESGAVDYITKPLQIDEVRVRINTHLTLRALQRQQEENNARLQRDITERKAQQQKMELLNSAVEQSSEGVHLIDAEGRIRFANAAFCRALGYERDELLQMRISDIDPNASLEQLASAINSVSVGAFRRIETTHRRHDGDEFPVEVSTSIVGVAGERFIMAFARDITERRRLESEALRHEQYQRTLLDNFPYFVWLKDEDSRLLAANLQYARVARVGSTRELEGKTDFDFFPHDLAEKYVADDRTVMADGEAKNVEEMYVDEHGVRHWMETWKSPVRVNGKVVGTVGCSRDITERKRMEDALHERTAQYQRQSDLLKSILESPSNVSIYALDREYRYLSFNEAYRKGAKHLWGTDVAVGMSMLDSISDDKHREFVRQEIDHVLAGNSFSVESSEEHVKDGHLAVEYHENFGAPIRNEAGEVVGLTVFALNVTERKRMEQTLAAREQEFRSLAESSPDTIIRYDREGRIRYLNAVLVGLLGLDSADEVIGQRPCEAWPDRRFDQIEQAAARAVETGEMQVFEMAAPGKNGALNYDMISVVPERDTHGDIIGTIAFGRDVTDLRSTERLMQMVGDHMPGALTHYRLRPDLSGELLYASRGLKDVYDVTLEELADGLAPMIARIHPDDLPKAAAEQQHAAKTLTTAVSEFRVNHSEKGEIWVQQITTPVPEADGSMLWYSLMFDITARKQLESELAASRDFLYEIIDGIADPIFVKDRAHRWVLMNAAFCELLGQSRESLLNKSDYDFLPVEQADEFWAKDEEVFLSGMTNVNEEPITSANGEMRHLHTKKSHFVARDGASLLIGVIRDITERKRMEEVLAERQAFLDSLFEAIPVPVFYKDRDGRYQGINRAFETVFGTRREQLIGKSVFDTYPKELAETYHAKDAEVFERRVELQQYEYQIMHGNGTLREVLFSKAAFTDAHGEVNGLIGAVIDITARKQADEAVRRSEQLLRSVIDATPDWIFIKDQEHRYRLVNQGYADALHLAPEEFIGKNDLDLGFPEELVKGNPEKGIRGFWADDRRVLDGNERQIYPDDPATINGQIHTFHTIKTPLRNEDGKPWGVLAFARDITERKQAERQLQETLEFSEGVINAIPDLLFEVDREGRYLNIWAQNPELLAAQKELLLGHTINEMLPSEAAAVSMSALREAEEKGHSLGKTLCLALPHGTSWFELSVSRKPGSGAGNTHFLVVSRDVTERKLAEQAVRENGEKLRSLYELSPLGIALTDMQGRYVEFNESFRAICGYPADELMTLDYWTLTPRRYEVQEMAQLESLAQTGRYGPYEKEYMQKDGTLVPIQLVGTLITGKDGTQYIWSIVEDIRERKRTEVELKERFDRIVELNDYLERTARDLEDQTVELEAQAVELEASQDQLKQTEAWYRSILHSAPDGLLVVDARGIVMLVNERLEAMFGYGCGELQGLAVEVLIPHAVRERHVGMRDEFIARDGAYRQTAKTLFGCRKDGTEFPVDVSLSRLPEVEGMRSAICASVRDISTRHAMEAAREAALAEMQHLAQLRSTFMAQMSHELRTPLNGILGYAQNLLQGEALGEKQTTGLQIIQHSGEHLLALINGILDHAAIEADKFELIPGEIELEPFLSNIIGMIRVRAEQKNLAFVCAADAGLPAVVHGDAQRLRQILLNLLSNAVKFTDRGQVTLRVTCPAPSRIRFAVQDSGIGIAPEQLETIFIPFEQGGRSAAAPGGRGWGCRSAASWSS